MLSFKYTHLQARRQRFTPMIYGGRAVKIDRTQGHLIHSGNIHISSLFVSSSFLYILSSPSFLPSIYSTLHISHICFVHPVHLSVNFFFYFLFPNSRLFFTRFPHGLQLLISYVCLCILLSPSSIPLPS